MPAPRWVRSARAYPRRVRRGQIRRNACRSPDRRPLSGTILTQECIYDHRQNGKGNSWPGRFILRLGLTRVPPTSRGDIREEVRARLGSRMLEFLALEPAPWLLAPYRGGGVRSRKSARAGGCGRARGTGGRRARAPCRRRWDSGRRPSRPRPGGGRGRRRAGPSGRR